ncbi:hypothetical protein D9M71_810460 [compost metagenome]
MRERAGYFEVEFDRRFFLFNSPALAAAAPGFGTDRIVRALVTADALAKTDGDAKVGRRAKKYRLPGGGSARFYVVDPERLEQDGGSQ